MTAATIVSSIGDLEESGRIGQYNDIGIKPRVGDIEGVADGVFIDV